MDHTLRMRILDQLLHHLEESDANDLRPKPDGMGIEVMKVDADPKDPMMEHADDTNEREPESSGKGPMEELMSGKSGMEKGNGDKDDEELSDDELDELVKQHLG